MLTAAHIKASIALTLPVVPKLTHGISEWGVCVCDGRFYRSIQVTVASVSKV